MQTERADGADEQPAGVRARSGEAAALPRGAQQLLGRVEGHLAAPVRDAQRRLPHRAQDARQRARVPCTGTSQITDRSSSSANTANTAWTDGLTCLQKHGGAPNNKFLVTHPMTHQYCLASAIGLRSIVCSLHHYYKNSKM
jgi:hypothetical protein